MFEGLTKLEKQEQTALENLQAAYRARADAREKVFCYVLEKREWHPLSELKSYAGEHLSEIAAVVHYSNGEEKIIVWEADYDRIWLKIEEEGCLHIIEVESRDCLGGADEYEEYHYDLDSGEDRTTDDMKIFGFVWIQLQGEKQRRGYAGFPL